MEISVRSFLIVKVTEYVSFEKILSDFVYNQCEDSVVDELEDERVVDED